MHKDKPREGNWRKIKLDKTNIKQIGFLEQNMHNLTGTVCGSELVTPALWYTERDTEMYYPLIAALWVITRQPKKEGVNIFKSLICCKQFLYKILLGPSNILRSTYIIPACSGRSNNVAKVTWCRSRASIQAQVWSQILSICLTVLPSRIASL